MWIFGDLRAKTCLEPIKMVFWAMAFFLEKNFLDLGSPPAGPAWPAARALAPGVPDPSKGGGVKVGVLGPETMLNRSGGPKNHSKIQNRVEKLLVWPEICPRQGFGVNFGGFSGFRDRTRLGPAGGRKKRELSITPLKWGVWPQNKFGCIPCPNANILSSCGPCNSSASTFYGRFGVLLDPIWAGCASTFCIWLRVNIPGHP